MLTGVDLQTSLQEKMNFLARNLCTNNQYPTGMLTIILLLHTPAFRLDHRTIHCFKILCGMLNDCWKHYFRFYPETPVTPLPTIQVEEDHFNVYLDWTFICSSKSIEESIAILIGLYSLMDLKFNTYRMAARFLYAYLINDQQKQPNNIRKIFKEHSIELVCMPISSVQHQHQSSIQLQHQSSIQLQHQSPSSVEQIKEINNNNNFFPDDRDDSVHDLVIDDEENDEQEININISTSKTILMKSTPKPSQKRKANHLPENTDLGEEENTPPRKKLTNSKRTKRH
ncbi:unnamed protein product [Rotaria sordida]|uniref:Uncharacterized protein n=1 Tax=Rotaria sordida TaxID=392033 RepID=A0A816EIN4_9BILA|nr:unnamed protein product [Rotaria sordida]CAF1647195.1 unnamed protein product [Rotaria sordida]